MAEAAPASPLGRAGGRGLRSGIIQWLVDNFCICEGYSMPRCLMYEIYVETCGQNAQNQVNPAMFGKLVRLVFPDLGTRRLGTRGSARYHYDGICIKRSSFFYAQYCYLLGEKRCPSHACFALRTSNACLSWLLSSGPCKTSYLLSQSSYQSNRLDESPGNYRVEKTISKGSILCDFIYKTY